MAAVDIDSSLSAAEAGVTPELQKACEPYVVVKQHIEIELNFRERSIHGTSTLDIYPLVPLEVIYIDARQCEVDTGNILVDGRRTVASYTDPLDKLDVPSEWTIGAPQHHVVKKRIQELTPDRRPAAEFPNGFRDAGAQFRLGCAPLDRSIKVSIRPEDLSKKVDRDATNGLAGDAEEECRRITIPFRSKTIRDGLQFVGVEEGDVRYPHVYTRHSNEPGTASCIFPCIDDPGMKSLYEVSVKFPRTLGDALEQPLATQQVSNGSGTIAGNRKRKHGEQEPQQSRSLLSEEDKLREITMICSGELTGEYDDTDDESKKVMSFKCHTAARFVGFAIGPFEHVPLWSEYRTEDADEKLGPLAAKIHGYCLPGRANELRNTCAPIVSAMDHFTLEYGRYPFDSYSYKLCFVDDMVHETVEAAGLSLCSNRLLYPEDIIDHDIQITRQLVHSLATQWLGVHIVPNKRTDTWLVVAIQWYITDLFMRTICGNNWYRFHLKSLSDKVVRLDKGRPSIHDIGEHLHVGDFELDFLSLKAPLVLFILDQRMSKYPGSIGVGRVISNIISSANISSIDSKATSLSADDFREKCTKKTQYKLDEFWQQWVKGAGCPRFSIKAKFNKKNLNVDITLSQTQADAAAEKQLLGKGDFWREFQEEINAVYAGTVTKAFTGPITVRIHEADGTPYEHYLDVKEGDRNGYVWVIPYNTKYKRLKRKSRREAGNAAVSVNVDGNNTAEEDVIYYNTFGDVLQGKDDLVAWGLQEWDPDTKQQMDQESYEWIRFDCNFEWLADITTDMPIYMYAAQLQQDRDVVAHQDAMGYFHRIKPSVMGSVIATRTVMDRRYYHGIRAMAVDDLPKYSIEGLNYIGEAHLILCFRRFFCYRVPGANGNETWPPNPNDFSNKAQYAVQSALVHSIAQIRKDKERGRCSARARSFLLDLLLFNDNSANEYSDQFYIASLLRALATSLIPAKNDKDKPYILTLNEEDDVDMEFKHFIEKTIEEIDRFRRMDEWTGSYQNIWTTTALECKKLLMKERVIPIAPLEFLQYLQDDNIDLVRIKAFECLVELGLLSRSSIMKFLLAAMSTDNSAFVRDQLFKIFCGGIASIALGEQVAKEKEKTPVPEDESGLILEEAATITDARKEKAARKEDIQNALKALKEDLKGNAVLQRAMWKAFQSQVLGLDEKRRLLDLCEAMFEPEDSLCVTLKYPHYWTVERLPAPKPTVVVAGEKPKKKAIMRFTMQYRTEPKKQPAPVLPMPAALPAVLPPLPTPPVEAARPPEPKIIKLQRPPSFSGAPGAGASSSVPPPVTRQPSVPTIRQPLPSGRQPSAPAGPSQGQPPVIRTSTPALARAGSPVVRAGSPVVRMPSTNMSGQRPSAGSPQGSPAPSPRPSPRPSESILVSNSGRVPLPTSRTAASPPPPPPSRQPLPSSQPQILSVPKSASKLPGKDKKRKSEVGNDPSDRPKKVQVNPGGTPRPRQKLVTLKFTRWSRLRGDTYRHIMDTPAAGDSIVATPAMTRPLAAESVNGSSAAVRHPLPGVTGNVSGQKVRKPLPGGPPREDPSTPGASSGAPKPTVAVSGAGTVKPASMKIKLKVKPAGAGTPKPGTPKPENSPDM
jgi:transcription initiation factor TFIID subunit 2